MKQKLLFYSIFFILFCQSQNTLFNVGDFEMDYKDFILNYQKNKLDSDTLEFSQSFNEYLDLYIKFKLKVIEAKSMGLDTFPSFKRELEGYRKQLVKPYLTDTEVSKMLLEEAYDRLKEEVSVSHILLQTNKADDVEVFERANMIKKRLENGEDFIKLAKLFSEDPSVKDNNGNLGYFSALYMVYPFESAAYNTKKGMISDIVKTRFGYHILKVNDRRPSRGEVKVAHILIRNDLNKNISSSQGKINEIYDSLNLGASFEELAKKYSDDKKSSVNGGELEWFGTNKMVKSFEDVSFSLKKAGEFSSPFQTEFGWHIVKLVDKKSLPSFDEVEQSLKKRIERDSRSKMTREVVINRLKNEWGFHENINSKKMFYKLLKENLDNKKSLLESFPQRGKIMFVFNNMFDDQQRYIFQKDFAEYLSGFSSRLRDKSSSNIINIVDELYETFKESVLLEIESANLEEKYDDFRLLYNEYRDGILMYQLQKEEVWDLAVKDTVGLENFYNLNKGNYIWPDRIKIRFFDCKDKKIFGKTKRKLRRNITESEIINEINFNSELNLNVSNMTYSRGDDARIDSLVFKPGIQNLNEKQIFESGLSLIYIDSILPSRFKKLNEIKGLIISDYQNKLEKDWIKKLEKKYPVNINNDLLSSIINNKGKIFSDEKKHPNKQKEKSSSFSNIFSETVRTLGSSKNTFFGWNGQIYTTEITSD
tara:strand:- start:54 stop:2171 length:2118 start_codon:yes stop_codon:yes gene_type:complete